jgi:hypothetical protein
VFLASCVNCGVCSRDFSLGRGGSDKNSFFLDFSTSGCKVVDSQFSMIFVIWVAHYPTVAQ